VHALIYSYALESETAEFWQCSYVFGPGLSCNECLAVSGTGVLSSSIAR